MCVLKFTIMLIVDSRSWCHSFELGIKSVSKMNSVRLKTWKKMYGLHLFFLWTVYKVIITHCLHFSRAEETLIHTISLLSYRRGTGEGGEKFPLYCGKEVTPGKSTLIYSLAELRGIKKTFQKWRPPSSWCELCWSVVIHFVVCIPCFSFLGFLGQLRENSGNTFLCKIQLTLILFWVHLRCWTYSWGVMPEKRKIHVRSSLRNYVTRCPGNIIS